MSEEEKKEIDQPEEATPAEPVVQREWRPQDADRGYFKYETRKRVQNYTVPPQTIFRPAKPAPTIRDGDHKRVAVYARVSTKSKEQVSSIENQTKYYTDKIARTPNWELAEIYADVYNQRLIPFDTKIAVQTPKITAFEGKSACRKPLFLFYAFMRFGCWVH